MLACNLQNYPGLILTNLKFATGHRINIVLKDRWIFNVIIGLKNLMWRKQFCYGPLYNIAQNSSPTTMYMQNGLYYGRTCSQNGLCTLFIDISKQNLNIHYISNLTPDLCTIQCKELGGCNTKMQYMYTTIHIRAITTFFLG